MDKTGPIIVIEDDLDDQMLFKEAFNKINIENEIIFFGNGEEALDYLCESMDKPFLILSDINMPKLNGFELKDKIQENEALKLKCIPYLFFTTSAEQKMVLNAYSKSVQGFFVKPNNYSQLEQIIKTIFEYWKICHAPQIEE